MKKNIWIIGVMAIQFALIIVLFLKGNGGTAEEALENVPVASAFVDTANVKSAVVAYVNGDSINSQYRFIKDKEAQLESTLKGADAQFQKEYAKREKEAQELIQYANSKQLPEDEARTVQERLAQLDGEIQELDAKMSNDISVKKEAMMKELNKRVEKYLAKFAKNKNIDFVLNYQEGIPIVLHGNPAFNVTAEVLAGLNAEYAAEKSK
jgi:Skp family chaperone for outer membrane proteins